MAQEILGGRLVSVQNQFSPAFRSQRARARALRRAGHRLPAVEPARRHRLGRRPGSTSTRPFAEIAKAHGVSPQQVCLAWELAKSPHVIPIPGSSRPETIRDSAQAVELSSARPSSPRWTASLRAAWRPAQPILCQGVRRCPRR